MVERRNRLWNLKYGDKVKIIDKINDGLHRHKFDIGETGIIEEVVANEFDVFPYKVISSVSDDSWWVSDDEIELVELAEFNDDGICVSDSVNKDVEDLNKKLKEKELEIEFLKGQISVYEKYMFD